MISLLVSPEELQGSTMTVEGDAYRHLFRARRLAAGARLRLTDGGGRARWGTVEAIGSRSAEILLGEEAPTHDPTPRIRLLVAVPRFSRASWMVEKLTELGAAEVRFLRTERTSHGLGEENLERLRRVAAAALTQCHGSTLPALSGPHEMVEVPGLLAGCADRRFLDLEPEAAEEKGAGDLSAGGSAALLVGPEGGWSAGERERLIGWGCRPWGLGRRVLRVETAAVVALALALSEASAGTGPGRSTSE